MEKNAVILFNFNNSGLPIPTSDIITFLTPALCRHESNSWKLGSLGVSFQLRGHTPHSCIAYLNNAIYTHARLKITFALYLLVAGESLLVYKLEKIASCRLDTIMKNTDGFENIWNCRPH